MWSPPEIALGQSSYSGSWTKWYEGCSGCGDVAEEFAGVVLVGEEFPTPIRRNEIEVGPLRAEDGAVLDEVVEGVLDFDANFATSAVPKLTMFDGKRNDVLSVEGVARGGSVSHQEIG